MAEMTKEWFIGFIEGEGNFNVALSKGFKTPTWQFPFEFYPILQFRIFLREDDLEVLEHIKSFLGFGKIYKKNLEYNRKKGFKARDQVVFSISSSKEIKKLKEFLSNSTFFSKKRKDMLTFFEIFDLKQTKKHLTLEGYNQIIELSKKMNSQDRSNFRIKPLTD